MKHPWPLLLLAWFIFFREPELPGEEFVIAVPIVTETNCRLILNQFKRVPENYDKTMMCIEIPDPTSRAGFKHSSTLRNALEIVLEEIERTSDKNKAPKR